MEMDGPLPLKSTLLINADSFAARVYLKMAQLSGYPHVCLLQGSGCSNLNFCPDLNESGREEFPQWDPESRYRFGSGPNLSSPLTRLVFLRSLHLLYESKPTSESSQFFLKGTSNQSDKWSDWLSPAVNTSCVPASAQVASGGCYQRLLSH